MTTIVWDGRMMVGDRQSTWGTTPTLTRKVYRVSHPEHGSWVFGSCGSTADCQAFARWANGNEQVPKFTDLRVLAVNEKGEVWTFSHEGNWAQIGTEQWAIGSGADYALGAMAYGATALEAVQIAAKLDVNTGFGGFDTVGLGGE